MLRKRLRDLAKDSLIYGGAGVSGKLANFLLLPLYTAYLSPADYGALALLALLPAVFVPVASLGLRSAVFRMYVTAEGEPERRRLLGSAVLLVGASALPVFAAAQLASGALADLLLGGRDHVVLVRLSLCTSLLGTFVVIGQAVLRVERRALATGTIGFVAMLVSVGTTIPLVVVAGLGIAGVVLGNLAGASFALLAVGWLALRAASPAEAHGPTMRRELAFSLPMVPHMLLLVAMTQAVIPLLYATLSMEVVGLFNVARKFAMPLALVVATVQTAWGPIRLRIYAQDDQPGRLYRSIFTYYFAGLSYLWLALAAWGPELLRLMTEGRYHGVAWLVPFVALAPVAQGTYYMLSAGFGLERTREASLISAAGVAVLVGVGWGLIRWLGVLGAALAPTVGYLAMAAVAYGLGQRQLRIAFAGWTVSGMALTAGGLAAVVGLAQDAVPALRLGVAAGASLLYPLAALAIIAASDERPRLLRAWHRLRGREPRAGELPLVPGRGSS